MSNTTSIEYQKITAEEAVEEFVSFAHLEEYRELLQNIFFAFTCTNEFKDYKDEYKREVTCHMDKVLGLMARLQHYDLTRFDKPRIPPMTFWDVKDYRERKQQS